jgi:hypothetical protein
MGRGSTVDQQTVGTVILDRLATTTVPTSVKPIVADFKKIHTELLTASHAAEDARGDRDAALSVVGTADEALDAAVMTLGDKMTGAQMGTRRNPFEGYSKYAPFKLTSLAYADEMKEVLTLVAKVKKAKPSADVTKAVNTCEKLANGVAMALAKLSKPQLTYAQTLAARDSLLPVWTKSLNKLKKHAAAAWFDDSATYKAVFAPPDRVQAPVHVRPKKTAAAATPSVPPPSGMQKT